MKPLKPLFTEEDFSHLTEANAKIIASIANAKLQDFVEKCLMPEINQFIFNEIIKVRREYDTTSGKRTKN